MTPPGTATLKTRLARWLLQEAMQPDGPHARPAEAHEAAWWKVMCLTGVDYFSTLGYQPGIAFLAAGALSPLATLVLVLLTLFGALPMYRRVAELSPQGQGSLAVLESLLPRWRGKALVLCLLGFAATGFIITITLSAADATAHIVENPLTPGWLHRPVLLTLLLLAGLGAIFLKGFREAIGLSVPIVAIYLALNGIVLGWGLIHIGTHPGLLSEWVGSVRFAQPEIVPMIVSVALVFPKLALGLSGFETGVAVMPLVQGQPGDDPRRPAGRIRGTHKLLTTAAVIMSGALLGSSFVTTLLIPPAAFQAGGAAYGRPLAYLAHEHFGAVFGTLYDLSTVTILWFAGASAMVGLLNLVPRYLPRYGMAPEWARANRPLVLLFTAVTFVVTVYYNAGVDSQAGAYATGVLVLMGSSALAVALHARSTRRFWLGYGLLTVVFAYTIAVNIRERPEGLKIAAFFVAAIVLTSLVSRVQRSTELRVHGIKSDALAERFLREAGDAPLRIIANRPDTGDVEEYEHKLREARDSHHLPPDARV